MPHTCHVTESRRCVTHTCHLRENRACVPQIYQQKEKRGCVPHREVLVTGCIAKVIGKKSWMALHITVALMKDAVSST